jgi:hypothetical protein
MSRKPPQGHRSAKAHHHIEPLTFAFFQMSHAILCLPLSRCLCHCALRYSVTTLCDIATLRGNAKSLEDPQGPFREWRSRMTKKGQCRP